MFGPQVGVNKLTQGDTTAGATNDAILGAQCPWLLLLLSAAAHAICYCKGGECESDDEDEPSTMYS